MDKVSLTYFVDFVLASGTPKLTVVRQFKTRDDYAPQADFYKKLREGIVSFHAKGRPPSFLDGLLSGLADAKKAKAYPPLLAAYKKFLGKKGHSWLQPPQGTWSSGGMDITLNPELGLKIKGQPTIIKLYFKETKLTKRRSDIVTHLLARELGPKGPRVNKSIGCSRAQIQLSDRRGEWFRSVGPAVVT